MVESIAVVASKSSGGGGGGGAGGGRRGETAFPMEIRLIPLSRADVAAMGLAKEAKRVRRGGFLVRAPRQSRRTKQMIMGSMCKH